MINIGFGPNILLGLILGFGVVLLYFLRIVKPEVARDEDIFFATIAAGADVAVMIDAGLMVFIYACFIIITHLIVIVLGAKLFKMDLAEIVIASLACIGGPVAPAAIAASRGWRELVTPGLMVGILGYAIANFMGVGLASLLAT